MAKNGFAHPLGNSADVSYLEEKFKLCRMRDVCTLCAGAFVSESLLHIFFVSNLEKQKEKFELQKEGI